MPISGSLSASTIALAIEIWGRDLGDTSYSNQSFGASATTLFIGAAPGEPRPIGITLRYQGSGAAIVE